MSVAKRLHTHFEATSVKGIYLLRRDPVAGELVGTGLCRSVCGRSLAHACLHQVAPVRREPLILLNAGEAH